MDGRMIAPTDAQRRTLRWLAAGAALRPITAGRLAIVANGATITTTRAKNVQRMVDAQWIVRRGDRYVLTPLGRAQANVKVFVAAYAEGLE